MLHIDSSNSTCLFCQYFLHTGTVEYMIPLCLCMLNQEHLFSSDCPS